MKKMILAALCLTMTMNSRIEAIWAPLVTKSLAVGSCALNYFTIKQYLQNAEDAKKMGDVAKPRNYVIPALIVFSSVGAIGGLLGRSTILWSFVKNINFNNELISKSLVIREMPRSAGFMTAGIASLVAEGDKENIGKLRKFRDSGSKD